MEQILYYVTIRVALRKDPFEELIKPTSQFVWETINDFPTRTGGSP